MLFMDSRAPYLKHCMTLQVRGKTKETLSGERQVKEVGRVENR